MRRIDETLLREGRGQAVGLYTRLLWRRTARLPIHQLAGYPRVAIPSVALS